MDIITIAGKTPSKKNSKQIVCRGRFPLVLPSQNFKDWHEASMRTLKISPEIRKAMPIRKAKVELTIYWNDMRKADLTNKAESVMDLLVDAGILEDDNWFVCGDLHLIFGGIDRKNPRAEVRIYGYETQKE